MVPAELGWTWEARLRPVDSVPELPNRGAFLTEEITDQWETLIHVKKSL